MAHQMVNLVTLRLQLLQLHGKDPLVEEGVP